MVAVAAVIVSCRASVDRRWLPMKADIARLDARRASHRKACATAARAQADDIVALARAPVAARVEPLPAVERALAERNLRAAVGGLDMQDGRVRLTFTMVRFDALAPLLDALARNAALVPADITLQPRVEPGFVRAEISLKGTR
jgi:type II secretory pathway component PulM